LAGRSESRHAWEGIGAFGFGHVQEGIRAFGFTGGRRIEDSFLPSIKPMRVGRSGEFRFLLERAGQNSETEKAYAEDSSEKG